MRKSNSIFTSSETEASSHSVCSFSSHKFSPFLAEGSNVNSKGDKYSTAVPYLIRDDKFLIEYSL